MNHPESRIDHAPAPDAPESRVGAHFDGPELRERAEWSDDEAETQTVRIHIPARSGSTLQQRHKTGETLAVTVPHGYVHETTIDGCQTADDLALFAALSLHTGNSMRVLYDSLDSWPHILGMSTRRTYASLDRLAEREVISLEPRGIYLVTSCRALEGHELGHGTTRYALVTGPSLAAAALSAHAGRTAPARNTAVFVALLAYRNGETGCATVSASRLQGDTGLGSSAVWAALDELVRAGLVEREPRYRRVRDGRGRARVYRGASTYLTHAIYTAEQADASGLGLLTDRSFSRLAEAAKRVRAERQRRRLQPD